jgi:hypothetical protein
MTKKEIKKLQEENTRLKSLLKFVLEDIVRDIKKIEGALKLANGTLKDIEKK